MSVNSINNSVVSSTSTSSSSTRTATSSLGKDEFLKLMVTQLRYQDPLNPTDNTEYTSQLAEFSALEQMNNVYNGISSMQALTMTGKMVVAANTDSTTGETTQISGIVDSVKLKSGIATLIVDGTEVSLDSVTAVYDYKREDVTNLSSMIGKVCKGYVYDSETLNVLDIEGTVTGIEKGTYEDYALMNGVQSQLSSILSDDYSKSQSKIDYLNDHIGEEVELEITSSSTGKTVPVTAVLSAVSQADDGTITVTLDGVKVPVDGIYSVNQNT